MLESDIIMRRLKRSQKLLLIHSLFVAFSVLLVLSQVVSSPSEPASAVLFGLSALRLVMALGIFSLFIFYAVVAFKVLRGQDWADRFLEKWFVEKGISRTVGWLSGISFGLSMIGLLLPTYRLGALEGHWIRLQPGVLIALVVSASTYLLFVIARHDFTLRTFKLKSFGLGGTVFVSCLFVMGCMFYAGFGVSSSEDFWYGAGVPILGLQLIFAVVGGILFLRFERQWRSKQMDVLICILIYIVTAYFWSQEPLNKSFLFTAPAELNNEFYPFADAANFDAASQFPLIGERITIFKGVFFERPLYLSFLVYLHLLFGQNYETLMAAQAGIFAVLPVLIYLIGRSLDTRSVGFGAAMVAIFRGINSIAASNMIDMANSKMMLTDFPTAIGVALVVLFLCEWLQSTENNFHYPIWIGGAIGLTLMLRTNALLLLALIPVYSFFKFTKAWKQWLVSSSLIVLGVVAITLPWEIRNRSLGGLMYGPILGKFQAVIDTRYLPEPQQSGSTPGNQESALIMLKNTEVITSLSQGNDLVQGDLPCKSIVCFSLNHLSHNILTSILILPTSPVLDDLSYLIRDRNPYYWQARWDGTFTGTAPLFLIINIYLITTGIAFAWKEKRLPGLAPLAIFLIYNLSNGLARTSGGRYIVPVDWIIPLYYLVGVFYLTTQLMKILGLQWDVFRKDPGQDAAVLDNEKRLSRFLSVFIFLFGFGSLIPVSEHLRSPRYQDINPIESLAANRSLIEAEGLDIEDLDVFIQSQDARILVGRALYPRFYRMNQGEFDIYFYPYITMPFPRTGFKMVGPTGEYSVVLPGKIPQYFPHASDVLVLGCSTSNYLDALVVIVLGEGRTIYTRNPSSELQCPLQQPVCSSNSDCQ